MTYNKENKEVNIIDPNPNNSYKTKKKFTGSYTEVNPKLLLNLFILYPNFTRGIPYVSKRWEERKVLIAEELAKSRYDIVSLQEVWFKYVFGKIDGKL